ncbi:MAG: imidazole glycerol phosphate synthase subunit HisH [Clostridiaceae bacterium]|nr:imidazole glycerol phosphate synthase subunit HisH [Clostridiaceae bacterium]
MIAIIDYGSGNLRSVARAIEKAGLTPVITSDREDILNSHGVVLPGVGAFGDCMESLKSKGLDELVVKSIEMGKPFLGICLGYQILFEESEEHKDGEPDIKGLAVFKGKVKRFPSDLGLKIPHIGWNSLAFPKPSHFFEELTKEPYFYFVHSYYVDAEDKSLVAAQANYGITFDAAIAKDNILAVQFHPEKSGDLGLTVIRNFLKVVKGS